METSTESTPQPDKEKRDGLAETTRLKAFSDGAFAIAVFLFMVTHCALTSQGVRSARFFQAND